MQVCKLKQALSVSRMAYFNWLTGPRIFIIPVVWVFFYELSISPMLKNAALMGTFINLLEPFTVITNHTAIVPLFIISFLILVSDCPKISSGELFIIHRTGKLAYLFGQMIYILGAALTFLASTFVFCAVCAAKSSFLADGWSEVTRFLSEREDFGMIVAKSSSSLISPDLYLHSRPYAAAARSFFLILLYMLLVAGIILLFNILNKKMTGLVMAVSVVLLGLLSLIAGGKWMWALPMANSIYGWHNEGMLAQKVYPVANSYIYFALVLTLLFILSCIAIKKSNINTNRNEG